MSNLRNDYVPCHYIFSPRVACHLALCHMSNLRNAHVALSVLGVWGHVHARHVYDVGGWSHAVSGD